MIPKNNKAKLTVIVHLCAITSQAADTELGKYNSLTIKNWKRLIFIMLLFKASVSREAVLKRWSLTGLQCHAARLHMIYIYIYIFCVVQLHTNRHCWFGELISVATLLQQLQLFFLTSYLSELACCKHCFISLMFRQNLINIQ